MDVERVQTLCVCQETSLRVAGGCVGASVSDEDGEPALGGTASPGRRLIRWMGCVFLRVRVSVIETVAL